MHTQEDFNRFVIKVAPDSSMQSCQTQHIKELISMEPRTWWRKFLGKKGKEFAFSGPQAWACAKQPLGAASRKRAMQPLLATCLGKETAFQGGIPMDNSAWLPFDKVAFTDDMMFSAAWSVQNRTSRREQRRVCIQIWQETTSRWQPPQDQLKMSTVPHRHNLVDINVALVITIMHLFMKQDNMLPARLLQSHNWAYTSAASGVSGKFQEEKPPMTRERQRPTQAESHWSPLASRDRRSPTPEFLGKKRQIGPPRRCSNSKQCGASSWMVPSASLQHQQAAGKLKRINEARGMSDRTASTREGAIARCTPACSILQLVPVWPRCRLGDRNAGEHGRQDQEAEAVVNQNR